MGKLTRYLHRLIPIPLEPGNETVICKGVWVLHMQHAEVVSEPVPRLTVKSGPLEFILSSLYAQIVKFVWV